MSTIRFTFLFLLFPLWTMAQNSCDCAERLGKLAWYYYTQEQYDLGLQAQKEAMRYKGEQANVTDYIMLAYLYEKNDSLELLGQSLWEAMRRGYSMSAMQSEEIAPFKRTHGQ